MLLFAFFCFHHVVRVIARVVASVVVSVVVSLAFVVVVSWFIVIGLLLSWLMLLHALS